MKPKMIWVGDATVATGFAKVTHKVLDVLKDTWEIHVLGINYLGEPYDYPYPVYPCYTATYGDAFGTKRLPILVKAIKPDVIVIQNDPWNIPGYLQKLKEFNIPIVAIMPVDGKNCRGKDLNDLAHAIFWTEFGKTEAKLGGYTGDSSIIPLGIDNVFYHRKNKVEARKYIGLPEKIHDAFIVGNINRNQPRKRLDLTIAYFCEWLEKYGIDDAYLSLHVCPTGEAGFDLAHLMRYYGFADRLIIVEPDIGTGIPEKTLVDVYNTFDIQITTTQGEGWGLTTMEGMACGVPQIVPDWSALGEWAKDAAYMVNCSGTICTPNYINVIGGITDKIGMIKALDEMYVDQEMRHHYSNEGFNLIEQPEYQWKYIGEQYAQILKDFKPAKIGVA